MNIKLLRVVVSNLNLSSLDKTKKADKKYGNY